MFGCNTGLIKARKVHCHFTEIFWLYFSYCLNVAVMCLCICFFAQTFCQNIKTLLFYDTLAYKPYSEKVFIFSLCKENFVSSWSKSFVLYRRQLLSFYIFRLINNLKIYLVLPITYLRHSWSENPVWSIFMFIIFNVILWGNEVWVHANFKGGKKIHIWSPLFRQCTLKQLTFQL